MADAITQLADAIEPSVFLPYMVEQTAVLSAFVQSGIVQADPEFDALINKAGGTTSGGNVTLPFWTELTGAADIISRAPAATNARKLTGGKDQATKIGRKTKWAANDLVKLIVDTEDPMTIIGQYVGKYWAREDQAMLLQILAGAFAGSGMSANVKDISLSSGSPTADDNSPNNNTMRDAIQVLGDAKDRLTGIAMHSLTENYLSKQDEIITIPASDGQPEIKTYLGKRIIIDDGLPVSGSGATAVYTTYIFGEGAIAWGEADLTKEAIIGGFGSYGAELARTADLETSFAFFRRIFFMHPRGVKWIGTPADEFPTNTELATGGNWSLVYEAKNVRIVQFKHNLV